MVNKKKYRSGWKSVLKEKYFFEKFIRKGIFLKMFQCAKTKKKIELFF